MFLTSIDIFQSMARGAMAIALTAGAQTPRRRTRMPRLRQAGRAQAPAERLLLPAGGTATPPAPLSTFVLTGPLTWLHRRPSMPAAWKLQSAAS